MPGVVWTVPAVQLPCSWQLDLLLPLEYCPLGQAVHTRSTVADGALLTKVPGSQVDHGAQLMALLAVLKLPLSQAEHTRSDTAVPSDETNDPGAQAVFPTQGVAALPSWSQVPTPQATCALVPPEQ